MDRACVRQTRAEILLAKTNGELRIKRKHLDSFLNAITWRTQCTLLHYRSAYVWRTAPDNSNPWFISCLRAVYTCMHIHALRPPHRVWEKIGIYETDVFWYRGDTCYIFKWGQHFFRISNGGPQLRCVKRDRNSFSEEIHLVFLCATNLFCNHS